MSHHLNPPTNVPGPDGDRPVAYEPPRLRVLGTLSELTAGGNVSGQSDGFGTAGGSGVM